MRQWLSLLAKALGPLVQDRYVVLLLDVHASYIYTSIFLQARRCGIRLVYIPATRTALLQPCDTHVFRIFKMAFRKAWRERKARALAGHVSNLLVIGSYFEPEVECIGTPPKKWLSVGYGRDRGFRALESS